MLPTGTDGVCPFGSQPAVLHPLHHTLPLTNASCSACFLQVVLADIAVGKSIVHVIGERPG